MTPPRYRPGMGLRPGGKRPEIEALIPALYAAFYDSVAAHSRHGLNVGWLACPRCLSASAARWKRSWQGATPTGRATT